MITFRQNPSFSSLSADITASSAHKHVDSFQFLPSTVSREPASITLWSPFLNYTRHKYLITRKHYITQLHFNSHFRTSCLPSCGKWWLWPSQSLVVCTGHSSASPALGHLSSSSRPPCLAAPWSPLHPAMAVWSTAATTLENGKQQLGSQVPQHNQEHNIIFWLVCEQIVAM